MNDSLYDYVLTELAHSKGRWVEVANATGVSHRTIDKIARREIKDPGVSHIEKLARYFRSLPTDQPTA